MQCEYEELPKLVYHTLSSELSIDFLNQLWTFGENETLITPLCALLPCLELVRMLKSLGFLGIRLEGDARCNGDPVSLLIQAGEGS